MGKWVRLAKRFQIIIKKSLHLKFLISKIGLLRYGKSIVYWFLERKSCYKNSGEIKILNEKSTKIAVVGTGGWGKNHVRVLNDLGVLTAVCDSDPGRVDSLKKKFKINSY